MIKFEHTKTYNWLDAIRGMRNSWESWDKMDSGNVITSNGLEVNIGPEDLKLMNKLVKAGSDHAKFLRQILVSVDVIAPEKFWSEFDTYKVGTVANSTSMMHTLGRKELDDIDVSFEDVDDDLKERLFEIYAEARLRWIESGKKKPSKEWRQMVMVTPVAFNYRRTVTLNYQVLRSMYHSRKNHRLSEWHGFAIWCASLPYSELITSK